MNNIKYRYIILQLLIQKSYYTCKLVILVAVLRIRYLKVDIINYFIQICMYSAFSHFAQFLAIFSFERPQYSTITFYEFI